MNNEREMKYFTKDSLISETKKQKILLKTKELIERNINMMKDNPNSPEGMKYFYESAKYFNNRANEIKNFKDTGGNVIGTFCLFVPLELIYAAGAIPIRLCSGFYETTQPANQILSDGGLCPLVKSIIGVKMLEISPYFEQCDVVISPITCDAKTKMGELLEDYLPVWKLIVPNIKDNKFAKKLWFNEINDLKHKIERLTGNKISKKKLKEAILMFQKVQTQFRRLYNIRKSESQSLSGRDALLVVQTLFYDDLHRWMTKTKELCDELEKKEANTNINSPGSDDIRILLCGSPIIWPNWKILNLVEDSGATIVCDEQCSSTRFLYDPIVVDEWTKSGMLTAMAERYLLPCTCPCFVPNDNRTDRILQLIKEFKVEGVVYHLLHGCHLYNIESTRIEKILKKENIPMLRLESEYDLGDLGQLKTRVEAFMEMIRDR